MDPDETFDVSPKMWATLDVVVARHQGHALTHLTTGKPVGDAGIRRSDAKPLIRRGFIETNDLGTRCWPTEGGLAAHANHHRRNSA